MNSDNKSIKKLGLQFLKELNSDKEDITRDLRINISSIKSGLAREARSNYTLPELLEILGDIEQDVNNNVTKAISIVSVKGVQRLRNVIDYGVEGALMIGDPDILVDDEQDTKKEQIKEKLKREKEELEKPIKDKMMVEGKEDPKDKLPMKIDEGEEQISPLEYHKTQMHKERVEVPPVPSMMEETSPKDDISSELENAFTHITTMVSTTKDTGVINVELFQLVESLEMHRNRLAITIAKLKDKDPVKTAELVNEIETIERKISQLAEVLESADISSSSSSSSELNFTEEQIEDLSIQARAIESSMDNIVAPIEAIEELTKEDANDLGEKLDDIYLTLKSSLMEPGKAIEQLTQTLSAVTDKSVTLSEETQNELQNTLNMFKDELRKRNIILEHTRKLLASNPKFNALFILQELGGGMPLSTLAKSVGIAPIVLKTQLRDFQNRSLITISNDNDPIVEIMFS